jgi:hypothetical protein
MVKYGSSTTAQRMGFIGFVRKELITPFDFRYIMPVYSEN